jgi:hypothetical protein
MPQKRLVKPGARIFDRVHLIRVAAGADDSKKLLRKKKNESWAMRPPALTERRCRASKSDSRVGGNLLCEIAHYVMFCSV